MAKREKNFTRLYDDKTGQVEIAQGDETLVTWTVEQIMEAVKNAAAMRYTADVIVGLMNAAIKAGKTVDEATALAVETVGKFASGDFGFRSGTGELTLSAEDEIKIIAEMYAAQFGSMEAAVARVTEVYNQTTVNAKGITQRKAFNAIKNDPAVKLALSKARGETSKAAGILAAPQA